MRVNYDQHSDRPRTGRHTADRLPALLSSFIDTIQLQQVSLILKYLGRDLEGDAVLLPIPPSLVLVPFVLHVVSPMLILAAETRKLQAGCPIQAFHWLEWDQEPGGSGGLHACGSKSLNPLRRQVHIHQDLHALAGSISRSSDRHAA